MAASRFLVRLFNPYMLSYLRNAALVLRSSNTVNESMAIVARLGSRPLPDPGFGPTIELLRGDARRVFNLGMVGEGLSSQRFAPEQPPPAFLQVEPTRAFRDWHLTHTR